MKRLNPLLPPVLLAAFPILSLFQHNQSEIALGVIWRPLLISVAVAAALFVLLDLALQRPGHAGALASLAVVGFFYFGILYSHISGLGLSDRGFFPVWLALIALGVLAVLRTRRDLVNLTWVLSVFAVVLVGVPLARIVKYRFDNPPVAVSDSRLWPTDLVKPSLSPGIRRPDIYFLMPDDYARPDVLKRYFGYDDSGFIHRLRNQGFVIAAGSRSPYSKSEFNMASTLNLDYLSRLPGILGKDSRDVLLVRKLIEDSRAWHLLRALGYRYIHLDSDNITFAGDNPQISTLAAPDDLTYLWLRDSVLRVVGGRYGFTNSATDERFRKSVRSAFARLAATAEEPGPKLVLFHTLMPHDPYIFGEHGERVTFPDQSDTGHSTKRGMRYYVKQLRFVNRELLKVTHAIRARSKTPPVIVIQSDEGFEALPEDWGEAAVRDMRVKGLTAFYLPGKPKARPPRNLNIVNSFRFLFDEYFKASYGLLPSASYPELDAPYQFEKMRVR